MPRLPLIVRGAVARATRFLGAPSRCNGVPNGAFYRLLVLLVVALVAAPSVVAHGPDAPPGLAIDPEDRFAPFDPSATPRVIAVATPVERAGELSGRGLDLWAYLPLEGVGIFLVDSAQELRLRAEGFDVRLDVERTAGLHAARAAAEQAPQGAGIPGFPCYRTVGETYADLSALAASHPEIAAWTSFGSSWQLLNGAPGAGDELFVLQLGRRDTPEVDQAPLVVIAAMHARELSTAEIVARFAETLVAGYGVDPDLTWLLDHRMIHIVAQLNPDGRARAEAGEFWRKNVNSDFCTGGLEGIDLNRNSSFEWGGGSSSECSEIFRGPSAASEPETAAIEAYLATVFEDQKGALSEAAPDDAEGVFLSFHSFGELILYPWEFTNSPLAPNHDALRTLGRKLAADSNYVVCQDCLGTASGTTPDVAYGEYGVAAYTFELGDDFFEECSDFEQAILPENLPALIYSAKAARRPYLEPAGPEPVTVQVQPATVEPGDLFTITATLDDGRFAGPEPEQAVASAALSIDVPPELATELLPLTAIDGTFDEVIEDVAATFSVDDLGLAPGRHLLFVTGVDAGGRRGVPTAAFLEIQDPPLFSDGFETGDTTAWD